MIEGDGSNPTLEPLKVVFCGDRQVGLAIVELMVADGARIVGLGLNLAPYVSHDDEIRDAAKVDPAMVFHGRSLSSSVAVRRLAAAGPDLGVCCGFGSILSGPLLAVPRWGWVNLHRSYLPYNRGVDPLQWAMVERTPAGVSLHVMTEEVDAGPVIDQVEVPILPTDSYPSLSARADEAVLELFARSWPRLCRGDVEGTPQDDDLATCHTAADSGRLRRLDPRETMSVRRLLDVVRGYTGDGVSSVYYQSGTVRYYLHLAVTESPSADRSGAEENPE